MSKVLSYQSLFFVPVVLAAQTSAQPWFETGGAQQPPPARSSIEARAAAASGKSQFAASNLLPMGWEIQPVQPPHPAPEKRSAAIARIDRGATGPLVNFQPPGWEIQSWQPPHRRPEIAGAHVGGDPGNEAGFINWRNTGWEVQPVQPPHARPEKSGLASFGDAGLKALVVTATAATAGWEVQLTPQVRPRVQFGALGGRSQFASFTLPPAGFEVQPWQPPHPRFEKSGAVQIGDTGTEAKFVFAAAPVTFCYDAAPAHYKRIINRVSATKGRAHFAIYATYVPHGWEVAPPVTLATRSHYAGSIQVGDQGHQAPLINWRNAGWETQSVQPPHARPEKSGLAPFGDAGLKALVVVAGAAPIAGWEFQIIPQVRPRVQAAGLGGRSQFASFTLPPVGFEVQPWQPPHWRPEARGAILRGDDGIQATKPAGLQTAAFAFGYDEPYVYPRKNFAVAGAIAPKSDGNDARFVLWRNFGWEIQSVQPPHRAVELKAGAVLRGDDGNQGLFAIWRNTGWEIAPVQPNHWRPEQRGAVLRGDDGIQGTKPAGLQTGAFPYGYDEPYVYPRKNFAVAGAIAPKSDGNDATFVLWRNAGWEIQSVQPPHRAPEAKFAALAVGDAGTQATYVVWRNRGWEASFEAWRRPWLRVSTEIAAGIEAPFVPPVAPIRFAYETRDNLVHPRRVAVPHGDQGTQARFAYWALAGFGAELPPPRYAVGVRRGASLLSAANIDAIFHLGRVVWSAQVTIGVYTGTVTVRSYGGATNVSPYGGAVTIHEV